MSGKPDSDQNRLVSSGKRGLSTHSPNLVQRGLEAVRARQARIVHFPKDRSMGTLWLRDQYDQSTMWLSEARGDITVPVGKELILSIVGPKGLEKTTIDKMRVIALPTQAPAQTFARLKKVANSKGYDLEMGMPPDNKINYHGDQVLANLAALANLKPNDLQELQFSGKQVSDSGLAYLKGLTALKELNLEECTQITDAGLAHLHGLTALRSLGLLGTQVSDSGLKNIQQLNALQDLGLEGTRVNGHGLAHLAGLSKLQGLYLDATQISDIGLSYIQKLITLRDLSLWGTQVTDAGLIHLRGLTGLLELSSFFLMRQNQRM